MNYINYKCPVCNNQFTEEDDVVVCPECGTPHHRECYIQKGECFNKDKHGTNQPIEVEFVDVEDKDISEEKTDFQNTEHQEDDTKKIVEEFIEKIQNKEETTIDGKPISFYEAAVGKNQKFYIPHFILMDKTQKNIVWNVAGFFVPFAWSLYRKMYKLTAIILSLYILMFGSVGYTIFSNEQIMNSFTECVQEDPNFYEDIILYNSKDTSVSLTEKQMKFNKLTTEFKIPLPLQIFMYIVIYGTRILMGIFSVNLYYKKISKRIKHVENLEISDDMKRSMLFRKFGTLPFFLVVIIGFFEFQMF